jgi:hypothetical protein
MRTSKPKTEKQPARKTRTPHVATVNTSTLHLFKSVKPSADASALGLDTTVWRSICNKVTVPDVHKGTKAELAGRNLCGICKRAYKPELHDE